jgi:hypothetical protein
VEDGADGCILLREEWGFAPGENTGGKALHRWDRQELKAPVAASPPLREAVLVAGSRTGSRASCKGGLFAMIAEGCTAASS